MCCLFNHGKTKTFPTHSYPWRTTSTETYDLHVISHYLKLFYLPQLLLSLYTSFPCRISSNKLQWCCMIYATIATTVLNVGQQGVICSLLKNWCLPYILFYNSIVLYYLYCTTCTILLVLYYLSCTTCTVLPILYYLYCTNCTVLQFWRILYILLYNSIVLYYLYCTKFTLLLVLYYLYYTTWTVLLVLCNLYCTTCTILLVLYYLYYTNCTVLLVL